MERNNNSFGTLKFTKMDLKNILVELIFLHLVI